MTTAAVQKIPGFDTHNVPNEAFTDLFAHKEISADPVMSILDIEYNELLRAWKRFQDYIIPSDHVKFEPRLQQAEDVLTVLRHSQEVWKHTRTSSVIRILLSLSERVFTTIGSHTLVLCSLSDYQLYCSVFYGVIQSILKASIQHYRVAAGFLKSLVEIDEAVAVSLRFWNPRSTVRSQRVTKLYSRIFLFLGEFIDSYIKKGNCRLLDSHNENFYLEFENLIENVKLSAGTLFSESSKRASTSGDSEIGSKPKHIRRTSSDLLDECRLQQAGLEGPPRRNAAQTTITRQLICDIQRHAARRMRMRAQRDLILADFEVGFTSYFCCYDDTVRSALKHKEDWSDTLPKVQTGFESPPQKQGTMHRLTKLSLQYASRNLQDLFSNEAQDCDFGPDLQLIANVQVIRHLRSWILSLRSEVVSLSGPHAVTLSSDIRPVAACCVTLARRKNIPVVAHFCSLPPFQPQHGATKAQYALIALGHSLIRQLIEIAPPVLDCDSTCDLSTDRFNRFDGTMSSWPEVLSVLDTLLYFAPPILIFAVDGLELLEDASTSDHIRLLLEILISHTQRPVTSSCNQNMSPQKVLLKILFTSAGRSETIATIFNERHFIVTESVHIKQIPVDQNIDTGQDIDMLDV